MMSRFAEAVADRVLRRPIVVLAALAVVVAVCAAFAFKLEPKAEVETLVGGGSESYEQTQRFAREFGGDPIVILVQGDLLKMALGPDLGRLLGLEGCLSGNVPASAGREGVVVPPVCREMARLKPAKVVYGPGTFVNTAARSILDNLMKSQAKADKEAKKAGDAARKLAQKQGLSEAEVDLLAKQASDLRKTESVRDLLRLGLQYGITSLPSVDNPDFVARVIFDPQSGSREPKARFNYLFPNSSSALIQLRMRPELSAEQRERTIELVGRATQDSRFQLENGRYTISGAPVVLSGLQDELGNAISVLLIAALIVMAAALLLAFSAELRLLPLLLGLIAAALTFAALAISGAGLTIASLAVLPVLIGLSVDYAIQFHSRFDHEVRKDGDPAAAVRRVARTGAPTIFTAAAATAAGLLMVLVAPVPLVRSFALLLIIGIVFALLAVLTVGFAVLGWAGAPIKERGTPPALKLARKLRLKWALELSTRNHRRALAIGVIAAVLGLLASTRTDVVTDVRDLVPSDVPVFKGLDALQTQTGVSGEIDVVVYAKNTATPAVLGWMREYKSEVLAKNGYKGNAPSCRAARLCPALSLTDLFQDQESLRQPQINALLKAVPSYFSQAVISKDRSAANMAFGIRLGSLDTQKQVVDSLRDSLDPPAGVTAHVVGLPVLAADASSKLSSQWRRLLMLALALAAVFGVLWVAFKRNMRDAVVPLIPIALASGWSSLVLWLLHVSLNPMSASLSAFVVAISTEFSVLLYVAYRRARDVDGPGEAAIREAYASTGRAIFASGVTAIAGFAALAATDIRMLRDFAFAAVIDLGVALLGVALVLPAAILWAEAGFPRPRFRRLRLRSRRRRSAEA